MRIVGTWLLGAGLAVVGVTPAAAAPAAIRAVAELRAGPGGTYAVIGRLPAGTPVEATACAGGWCRTQYGYVAATLLGAAGQPALTAPAPVAAAPALPATNPGMGVSMSGTRTTIGTANVRSGPGTEHDIVKTLPDATSVTVQGCASGWCRVEGGYVSIYVLSRGPARLVLPPDAQPRIPDPATQEAMDATQGLATSGLASPAAAPLSVSPAMDSGSMSDSTLGFATAPAVPVGRAYAPGAAADSRVTTSATADVRGGPGTNYQLLGTLPADFPVTVESCTGNWCRTQYGYVDARLVGRAPAVTPVRNAVRRRTSAPVATIGYWGARPGYWGGRPSYVSPQPGYPLPARS
ncbi:SH3 domain-containing protein [Ancylobacter sp. Lp-2]|uniref:SH3 domain-containing protein n=1 Tax=Ancylobacter sp. Lp-2 TaxID=2881339 RepID=UPI001E33CB54|nr:SH3 domain-containing protein [Ancylobacter sp. Lp-2]MCB4768184.1 SH3 domain-containing protein [Ancylobacter sp. Lp-2]